MSNGAPNGACGRRSASSSSDDSGPEYIVRTRGLSKRFGGNPAIFEDIDLALRDGETTVIMGPNGAGKTVLLSCLAGGLTPSEGSVEVFGRPPSAAKSRLVFMLQDGLAVDDLSGRENAAFYASLHPAATDRWVEVADRLELADLDRRVGDYSGGMKRKLELAVTLSVDVPLYLLDEPTSELDMTAVEQFHATLDDLAAAGKTVVMTSHSPRDFRTADRLVFFARDGVVADGPPTALRAAVPRVVVVEGWNEALDGVVRDGRLFDTDAGRRGFLAADADPDAVAARPAVRSVEAPTSPDVFNYYVHLRSSPATR